jgi:hypothetical protein
MKNANDAIDAITHAMSLVSRQELRDDTLTATAYEHLRDARQLLIAKYQPNMENQS